MLGQPHSGGSTANEPDKAAPSLILTHLLGALSVPLIILDTSGRAIRINPQAEALLGRAAQDCVGMTLASLTVPNDRGADPAVFQALSDCLSGKPLQVPLVFSTPRGPMDAVCSLIPAFDPQGVTESVVVLFKKARVADLSPDDLMETPIRILARASADIVGDDLEETIETEAVRLVNSLGLDFVVFLLTSPDEKPITMCHGIDEKDAKELMESEIADGSPLYLEVARGKSMVLDASRDQGIAQVAGVRSVACLAVRWSGKPFGCAFFGSRNEMVDLNLQYPLLQVFCNQVAVSLRNAMLCRELRLRNNELRSLNETSRALLSSLDLHQVLHTIMHHAMALVDAEDCFIFELDPVRSKLRLISTINSASVDTSLEMDLGAGLSGQVAVTGKGRLVERTDLDPSYRRPSGAPGAAVSVISVPLTFSDKLLGVMTLEKDPGTPFTRKQYELIETVSLQAAMAIHNASLFEKVKSYASNLQMYNVLLTHDVANFNVPIHGFLEMLLKDPQLEDRQRRYVHSALVQSGNISELISNVRELSTLRSKGEEMPLGPVDMVPAIIQAKEDIFSNAVYEHINVTFHCLVPKAEVMADVFLKDLFYNLLSNACKYGGSRPVEIVVTEDSSGGQEYWRVRIADGGKGIPNERKASLFNRIDQMDTVQAADGHGLGLSVVGTLCDRYGGKVWVEDRIPRDHSKGAVFNVLLPKLKRG
ncbi:GAF domain-containing protein [Methanomassiliicoccus luminyensis]|uniref:GAF domain-containing protein n=1 Tax=Methanomassiliicoccus luminyensis TaxID=1080712 RepID=UPI00035DECDE|nr:GAF domain-containing protein [Methanomassiliicoccus luminyensis]